jgi:hypothetical protein
MLWKKKHPQATMDMLGFLPMMFDDLDPRPAAEQANANYSHGGGWKSFPGHKMLPNGNIQYPGDPPTRLLFETQLRDETIRFYEHAWVAIIQPDGSFEVCRMD